MERRRSFLLLFLFPLLFQSPAPAAQLNAGENEPVFSFVFLAVLEGLYRDGLADDDVDRILEQNDEGYYVNFVYSCPICMPTINALRAYRSRPVTFFGEKRIRNTLGPGLSDAQQRQLASSLDEERLLAIRSLVERWVDAELDRQNISVGERMRRQAALDRAARTGAERLERFRFGGNQRLLAPAFGPRLDCAACSGAASGARRD